MLNYLAKLLSHRIILVLILLLGLIFRIYKLEIFYAWGHDQDLFAWIAKDIIIDHHFRLIGQETSITGVFIGPLFYYLIALSFVLFKMNPLSAAFVTTVISLFTIFSIYWIFNKIFSQRAGLIGAFLYAISPGVVFIDRWVVPTQPTILWTIWYLYTLFLIIKGNIPILLISLLSGLIWHVHIAFIPLLILLPLAHLLSEKKARKFKFHIKSILISLLMLIILIAPFVAFEIRHGFQQTKSLISATYEDREDLRGVDRLIKVVNLGGRSLAGAFLLSNSVIQLNQKYTIILPFLLLIGVFYLWSCRVFTKNQMILILVWILLVFLAQFFSKRIITEYYFNNLFVVLFLTLALILSRLRGATILLTVYLIGIVIWFINKPDDLGGFLYKRQAIEYIKSDANRQGYSCIAINHIENQAGGATGFRYLFWLNDLSIITSGNDVPVYSIVNPWTISKPEISAKFGRLGVIVPPKKQVNSNVCNKSERQLLPLWGFNN